ncbi:response regulator transcription factor [Oleomonas cavernae]|nr:response regulator transcription factor [Oleomonas cavernae]
MPNRNPRPQEPARLLVAVGDEVLRRALVEPLAQAGYIVEAVAGPQAAPAHFAGADLVLVDRAEGAADAVLTAAGCTLPIVALTAADDSRPPAGAGGQVSLLRKPLRIEAVLAGVQAGLAAGAGALAIGPCRLFASSRMLVGAAGEPVRLTDKETQILARLAAAIGRVVPREILLAEVWGYGAAVATHTIETHVYRLRRKLAKATADGAGLILAEGGGYRLAIG